MFSFIIMSQKEILSEIENNRFFQNEFIWNNIQKKEEVFNSTSIGKDYMNFEVNKEKERIEKRKEELKNPRKLQPM